PAAEDARALAAEIQILAHGQGGEDLAVLGHVADAGARDEIGAETGDVVPLEPDLPDGRHQAHDGLAGGAAAHAVATEEADDLPRPHVQVHALQDVALPVVGVQLADLQHQPASAPR